VKRLVLIRRRTKDAKFFGVKLVNASESPELTLQTIEISMMVGVGGGEAIPTDQVICHYPSDHVHWKRQPRDPRRTSRFVREVKLGRRFVLELGLCSEIVAYAGEEVRLNSVH
jgi:hypothetical protein